MPAQFYIANVGGAVSKGVELEIGARAAPGVDLFTSVGYTHARFAEGSISSGVNVEGNKIPNTPEYTASAGVQYSRAVGPATILGRADAVFYGSFQYNDQNSLGPGGVFARQPPPRGDGPIPDGRTAHSKCLRHPVHSVGVPLSELRPVRLHGRDGRSAHRQRERGCTILSLSIQEFCHEHADRDAHPSTPHKWRSITRTGSSWSARSSRRSASRSSTRKRNGCPARTDLIDTNNIRCRWQNHVETGECRFDCFDPVIDLSDACERAARDPKLLEIVSALYGEPACLFKDKLIFKPPARRATSSTRITSPGNRFRPRSSR